jgi:hypothetical protein
MLILGEFSLIRDVLLLHKPSALLGVHVEYHTIYDHNLCEKLQGILADISGLVVQTADYTLQKLEVMMARDHISLSQF